MTFKPMLASAIEDTSKLKFPILVSIKLDGIRATVQGGRLLTRSLKEVPNRRIQEMFKNLPEGLDGELIYGDPSHKDCYRNTTSIVMSEDKDPKGIVFHVFDVFGNAGFQERLFSAATLLNATDSISWYVVYHQLIDNEEQLLEFETKTLEQGHEGVMVRSLNGPYKQGRSSVKEGHLLKLKRFVHDAEAVITGFYEEMENQNEAKTNNLGRTERSSAKSGLVGKRSLGGFEVEGSAGSGAYAGVRFQIGGGFTAELRRVLWEDRKKLIGKIVKYKYFPSGSKDRPRFPVFLGFRDKRDM